MYHTPPDSINIVRKEKLAMPSKIRKRSGNKYTLSVSDGYTPEGKQIVRTKTITATSKLDAQRQYNAFEAEIRKGQMAYTQKFKLAEFAEVWLKDHCEKNLAPKTVQSYRNQLKYRILPALGAKPLTKITPIDIINFLNDLRSKAKRFDGKKEPLSDKVIASCFNVLSSMLTDAAHWQVIDSNPCMKVERPKVQRKKMVLPEEENIANILKALQCEPLKYKLMITLAIATGLRRGELMGLQWKDINLDTGIISVNRSVQEFKKQFIIKAPKTVGSVRSLVVSGSVLELLKEYKREQDAERAKIYELWEMKEAWVFTQWNGKPMNPGTSGHWWLKFLKRHQLPHMPFHGLRHISATILIAQGVPLKNVSARLGHTDIRTTANIYADALESVDRNAADKMDQYLKKKT